MAQNDDTLLEMFISFAAAKEAAMRGMKSSKDYFVHKGRALQLVSDDIARKPFRSTQLNLGRATLIK